MANLKMQLVDWLDDLCVRFIINLPQEELESVERICFQVEEAQWFYEDFIRPLDPSLPSMNLKKFCLLIFQHCPLFSDFSMHHHAAAYSEFLAYKTRVPVRGAIMLNDTMDSLVLVKGWKKGARWGFPRGKINKDEKDLDCAVREVYEETGFDIQEAGLVKHESEMKYIEVTMREQHMRLYVFRGVPMDTHFEPRTRKEISKIDWYKLSDLPTQKKQRNGQEDYGEDVYNSTMFYMVAPFLGPLRRWIKQQKKLDRVKAAQDLHAPQDVPVDADDYEADGPEESAAYAGETTADEDASGLVTRLAAPDSHFNSLLAGLRNSTDPVSALPGIAEAPTQVDAAAELKRLLSVSGPSGAKPPDQEQAFNPLLAMLRGGQPGSSHPSTSNAPPRTPVDQIAAVPPQPQSPHHQHPRPPVQHTQAPPPFPFDSHQPSAQRSFQTHQSRDSFSGQPPRFNGPQHMHPHAPRLPMGMTVPPNGFPQSQFQAYGPAATQSVQGPPRPYQRTGDPQFSQNPSFPNARGPVIPLASQLPPPKLNAHTLNLLNAFKNPETAKAAIATQGQAKFAEVYSSRKGTQSTIQRKESIVSALEAPSDLEAIEHVTPNIASSPEPLMSTKAFPSLTIQPKPRSAHQDALLNLFRAPSTSAASPLQNLLPSAAATEPVELAAQPSPAMPRPPLSNRQLPLQAQPAKIAIPKEIDTIANAKSGLTSATVSGPLNEPNFDTLQRQRLTPQSHLAATNGRLIDSPANESTAPIPVEQIRSSPTIGGRLTPKSQLPAGALLPSHIDALTQKIPVQPAITARPNNHMRPPLPAAQAQAAFDRRESQTEPQRRALLSLFGKGPSPQPPVNASGIISPVSPLPEKSSLQHSPALGDNTLARSRIGSITNLSASEGKGLAFMQQQQQQQPKHEHGAQGRKTPVTPIDRSFLLGYLEGVAKGQKR